MKREYYVGLILGLLLLAYVLEAVANPLQLNLSSPYAFAQSAQYLRYPFSTAIIFIRAIAVFLIPLVVASLFKQAYFPKAISFLLLSGLVQLYALQAVVTGILNVPLEWALSLTLAGLMLLVPAIYYLVRGMAGSATTTVQKATVQKTGDTSTPDWFDD